MTDSLLTSALALLQRRLGLTDPDENTLTLMEDCLDWAESEILLYLGRNELEGRFIHKLSALAALGWQRIQSQTDTEGQTVTSASYTEGQISQTEHYTTAEELDRQEQQILDSLGRWRVVPC